MVRVLGLLWAGFLAWGGGVCPAAATAIPVNASVHRVADPARGTYTYLDLQLGKEFTGPLPEAIEEIRVTGPEGDLPLQRPQFRYRADARLFWAVLPGPPSPGTYRFQIRAGTRIGAAKRTRQDTPPVPTPDAGSLGPLPGATLTCPSPTFSWASPAAGGSLYCQVQIQDATGREVYRSRFARDRLQLRPPPRLFEPGRRYRWRVRVADRARWTEIENRSHSAWSPLSLGEGPGACEYQIETPRAAGDGWEVSSPTEVGFDPEPIRDLVGDILSQEFVNIDGVVIARGGNLVVEEYFNGYGAGDLHVLYSVTKSVTSLLVGIAADQGSIPDLDAEVHTFFPERRGTRWVAQRYPVTLRHLLTMSAGIQWDARTHSVGDPRNDASALLGYAKDPVGFVLDKPMATTPGEAWNYNGGLTLLVGAIVGNRLDMPVDEFAGQYLFSPLGISAFSWNHLVDGTVDTPGGLRMRPRDMAKIGRLVATGGRFGGRQLVSEAWIRDSTAGHVHTGSHDYGYQWYSGRAFIRGREIWGTWAWGLGGQVIFACPELDLVVVVTSTPDIAGKDYFNEPGLFQPLLMLERYILPALLPTLGAPGSAAPGTPGLEEYVGEYAIAPGDGVVTVFRQGDTLYATAPGGTTVPMRPERNDLLAGVSPETGPFRVRATRDSEGRVDGGTLYFSRFVSKRLVKVRQ